MSNINNYTGSGMGGGFGGGRGGGYIRPKKTYTDTIQNEDIILEKLMGYEEIEDAEVDTLLAGTNVRYIKWDTAKNKERFITGGSVVKVDPRYLILKGKDEVLFSAQRYTYNKKGDVIHVTRFFKEVGREDALKKKLLEMQKKANEIILDLENTIDKQTEEINQLKGLIKKK